MAFFESAHNFRIENLVQNVYNGSASSAVQCLASHCAYGADYGSEERCEAPKCHPDTRIAIQTEIMDWIGNNDPGAKKILWVAGPAGAGKTAIAGSVAELCEENGSLAGNFFFSTTSADCCTKRRFVATLAHQLCQHDGLAPVAQHILAAIERNPAIFRKRLRFQLEDLVLKPLRAALHRCNPYDVPTTIIVDGLDECGAEEHQAHRDYNTLKRSAEDAQLDVLSLLFKAVSDSTFPFRFIVFSRPETAIEFFFSETAPLLCDKLFLNEKYNPDQDITTFLEANFRRIRMRYRLPHSWPGNKAIQTLVDNASGQFIYAAAVLQFVQDSREPPQRQLALVLDLRRNSGALNPFHGLDALYTHIVQTSPNPLLAASWIFNIGEIQHSTSVTGGRQLSAAFCIQFMETEAGEAEYLLGSLRSLIHIPPAEDRVSPFTIYHKSLRDFLWDTSRCSALLSDDIGSPDELLRFYDQLYSDSFFQVLIYKQPSVHLDDQDLYVFLIQFRYLSPTWFSRYLEDPAYTFMAASQDEAWPIERYLRCKHGAVTSLISGLNATPRMFFIPSKAEGYKLCTEQYLDNMPKTRLRDGTWEAYLAPTDGRPPGKS